MARGRAPSSRVIRSHVVSGPCFSTKPLGDEFIERNGPVDAFLDPILASQCNLDEFFVAPWAFLRRRHWGGIWAFDVAWRFYESAFSRF